MIHVCNTQGMEINLVFDDLVPDPFMKKCTRHLGTNSVKTQVFAIPLTM